MLPNSVNIHFGHINKERLAMQWEPGHEIPNDLTQEQDPLCCLWSSLMDDRRRGPAYAQLPTATIETQWEEPVGFHSRDWLLVGVLRLHMLKWRGWVCVKEKCLIQYLSTYSLVIIFPIIDYLNMLSLKSEILKNLTYWLAGLTHSNSSIYFHWHIKSHILFKESNNLHLYYTIILLLALIKYIILFNVFII